MRISMYFLILFAVLVALCVTSIAMAESPRPVVTATLATAATATGTQAPVAMGVGSKTFQATLTSTGSGSATVAIEGSLNGSSWDSLGTLSPSNTASDSITLVAAAYTAYRANVTAITGTAAAVTVKGGN
jgi:hypothetical protein